MKRMIVVTALTIIMILTGTLALAQQSRPLAKIRVDDSGNVEILEINISKNRGTAVQTSHANPETSGNTNMPAVPMSIPDLEFVASSCSYDFEFLEFTFNIRIRNTGTDPTGSFSIAYYLSEDQILNQADKIYSHAPGSIAGGATVDIQKKVDAYDGELHYLPGIWYVGCVLDDLNHVTESNENNNTHIFNNKLTIPEIPDLTVGLYLNNNDGPLIAYELDIINNGTENSDPCVVASFLSTDQILDAADDLVHEVDCSAVGRGWYAHYYPSVDLTGVPGGEYYMISKVDYYNVVDEFYEDNNVSYVDESHKISVPYFYPDLVVSLIQLPDEEGPEITYIIDVMNIGDVATSGTFKNKIYLSTDDIITDSDYLINDWNVTQSILPGNYKRSPDLTTTVSGVPYGEYWLGVIADSEEDIDESNENNNTGYYPDYQVIIDLPDLYVIDIEVLDQIGPDIHYQFFVDNGGLIGTEGVEFDYTVFLSLDNLYDPSDYQIEQGNMGALGPEEYTAKTCFTNVTGVPNGEYFLIVIIDFNEAIDETDEINNEGYAASPKVVIGSSSVETKLVPKEFDLKAAYPNPFNASATIQFDLPESCPVSLKIYSSTGQHIATLVDEFRSAGVYPIVWNAEDLPSGMYMVQLKAGDYTETKKLILQK